MKVWIAISLLYLPIFSSAEASLIQFSYTRDFVTFGQGSFGYDFTNPASVVSNFELDGINWNSVQYSSFVSNDNRIISVQAFRGSSFANILLTALDASFPVYPVRLALVDFESGRLIVGNSLNPAGTVYEIDSLGDTSAVPLPASLWFFVSGLVGLALKLKSCK